MKIKVDFGKITGKIKPMHGVGQPPFYHDDFSMFHYLTEAGIPYSRLHDVGGPLGCGLYVDIPNIFRDFDADPYDPGSYDFTFTDRLIKNLCEAKCEPFFRLGVTIENSHMLKAYRIFPPKDPQKWAVICEHIVSHYNRGWADGYRFGIKYWEIWNEPDDCYTLETSMMWRGTPEQFYELYDISSRHLKSVFGDEIAVGGYAHCGFYAYENYPDLSDIGRKCTAFTEFFFEFLDGFFKYIKAHGSPLDFFSWHTYADVKTALKHADVCREILDKHGFENVPDILNEWNPCADAKNRNSHIPASRALAFMLGMQYKRVSLLCYYDARLGPSSYGGLFNPDTWEPYPAYYAFKAFNEAYKLLNQVECITDSNDVFVLAASHGDKKVILIANIGPDCDAEFNIGESSPVSIKVIDETHTYSELTGTVDLHCLHLSADSCYEISFNGGLDK